MMKNIFLLVAFFLFFNCSKKDIVKDSKTKISNSETSKILAEDFNEFSEKFFKDFIYQKNRVIFPLKYSEFDVVNLKTTSKIISEKEFEGFNIDNNEVFIEKKISNDSAKIILKGKENGILIELKFLRTNSFWKLKSIDDQST